MKIREYSRRKNTLRKIPNRYVPQHLSSKDKQLQLKMLKKSRRMYKNKKYFTRKRVASFKNKKSSHIQNAERIYGVKNIVPNQELARKTGCSLHALNQIVKKGEIIAMIGDKDEDGDAFMNFEIRIKGKAVDPLLFLP